MTNPCPSLITQKVKAFGVQYSLAGAAYFLEVIVVTLSSIFLGYLLRWFQNSTATSREGFLWAMAMSLSTFTHAVLHHVEFYLVSRDNRNVVSDSWHSILTSPELEHENRPPPSHNLHNNSLPHPPNTPNHSYILHRRHPLPPLERHPTLRRRRALRAFHMGRSFAYHHCGVFHVDRGWV